MISLLAVLGAALLLGLLVMALYNSLVRSANMVREGLSGVDVQLTRRRALHLPHGLRQQGPALHHRQSGRAGAGDHHGNRQRGVQPEASQGAEGGLQAREDTALRTLFKGGSPLEVERSNRAVLSDAQSALRKALRDSYTGYLFNPNLGWFWPGVAIALAAGLTAVFSGPSAEQSLFMVVWLGIWTAGTVMLLSRVAASWHEAVKGRGSFMA